MTSAVGKQGQASESWLRERGLPYCQRLPQKGEGGKLERGARSKLGAIIQKASALPPVVLSQKRCFDGAGLSQGSSVGELVEGSLPTLKVSILTLAPAERVAALSWTLPSHCGGVPVAVTTGSSVRGPGAELCCATWPQGPLRTSPGWGNLLVYLLPT